MKLKTRHTALSTAVLFTLVIPFSSAAQLNASTQEEKVGFLTEMPEKQDQEMSVGNEDPETRLNNENPENRLGKNGATPMENVVVRDSDVKNSKPIVKMAEKPQKEEKEDEKLQEKEEDPLSFNFLYYIIEKFKLSDIVE